MTPALAVLEFHLVGYRRTWRGSALQSFVLPLLTMLGFGVGVGAYVRGGIDGAPYLDWMVPGLIASTAMQVAFAESTWPVFSKFEWLRTYFAQAASPLRVVDILGGHLAYMLLRVLISTTAFLAVAASFGTLHSWWALATPLVGVLLGLAVAALATAYSSSVSSDSYLAILIRFAVLPMSLFSGVFFPIEALPAVLRWLAYALPLWHAVDLSRSATLGTVPSWPVAGHVLYLTGWALAGCLLAHRQFRRRLVV